jgi:branched-chain amino acid transport system substrate-binding protein
VITRRTLLAGAAALTAPLALPQRARAADDIVFGVSGPFSGDDADYGRVWRLGMDLARDELNARGGLHGRKLVLDYEDTQSDPKESVVVAERFVDDARIVAELGDFSSAASIAAAPIYERARLLQFGFTNSAPAFTQSGSYMWSTARTTSADATLIAHTTLKRYGRSIAIAYQDSAWGVSASSAFVAAAHAGHANVVSVQSYLPAAKDFRAQLSAIRAAKPDVLVLFAYYTDGALLLQQAADVGLDVKIVTSAACYNQKFIELGGDAVEGAVMPVEFFAGDPRPDIQRFVRAYVARYHEQPDLFATYAYDAVNIVAWAAQRADFVRAKLPAALAAGSAIPSVVNGPFRFGPDRRVEHAGGVLLTIRKGAFVLA